MTDYPVINGLIFCGLGVIVFIIAFSLVLKLAPLDLWKQIGEERNVAAAILAGAVALGICWIIAPLCTDRSVFNRGLGVPQQS